MSTKSIFLLRNMSRSSEFSNSYQYTCYIPFVFHLIDTNSILVTSPPAYIKLMRCPFLFTNNRSVNHLSRSAYAMHLLCVNRTQSLRESPVPSLEYLL